MAILETLASRNRHEADFTIYSELAALPHFDPDAEDTRLPQIVLELRTQVAEADAVIFCTPEYVFSVPAILKNAIEWCVASTVFSDKPTAMIVASGGGEKTFESLGLILRTIQTRIFPETMLLLNGVRGRMRGQNFISDSGDLEKLDSLWRDILYKC